MIYSLAIGIVIFAFFAIICAASNAIIKSFFCVVSILILSYGLFLEISKRINANRNLHQPKITTELPIKHKLEIEKEVLEQEIQEDKERIEQIENLLEKVDEEEDRKN